MSMFQCIVLLMSLRKNYYGFESGQELKTLLDNARKPLKGSLRIISEFSDGLIEEDTVDGKYSIVNTEEGNISQFTPARWERNSTPIQITEEEFVVGGLGCVLSRRKLD